jgi:hypothetical protein
MNVIHSPETAVHILGTLRYISEDGNINNYRYENLKLFYSLWSKIENNKQATTQNILYFMKAEELVKWELNIRV